MLGIQHLRALRVLLALAVGIAPAASGQFRGTVRSADTGEPLGFSVVELHPRGGAQFTSSTGVFEFPSTPAGRYLLQVRQIGYIPLDTQIVLRDEAPNQIEVALRRLAIELPPVTIAALPCVNPGPPDSSEAPLFALFEQLQENARRYKLLADSFPFSYVLEIAERSVSQRGDTGKPFTQRLRFSSTDNQPYEVGRVVGPAYGPWGDPARVVVIRSADLEDLANPSFIKNHCFRLAGFDSIGGEAFIRIDFEPATRIGTADMAGAAFLDTATYELRYTQTSLTRPERSVLTDVQSMTFLTRFRNIAPGIPLQDSLTAVTTYRYGPKGRAKIDTQRTLDVRFRKGQPPP